MTMTIRKEHELYARRRSRNIGVLGALAAFAVLLFAVTVVKMGPNAGNPSVGESWGERLMQWVQQ